MRDSLGVLADRAAALQLPPEPLAAQHTQQPMLQQSSPSWPPKHPVRGQPRPAHARGELHLSRLLPGPPLAIKSVVQYSPQWVKSQVGCACFDGDGMVQLGCFLWHLIWS